MRILHLSAISQLAGAGIAAYRLHKGLRSLGADSWMLVNRQYQPESHIVAPTTNLGKLSARAAALLDQMPGRLSGLPLDRVSSAWVPDRLQRRALDLTPDILNLHWINDGFMRIETLSRLRLPIIWTFHDMWAFSGGEHYVGDSTRYAEGYTSENRPTNETGLDINRWIWKRKKKSWSELEKLVVAAPSKWMAECAGRSDLFGNFRIEVLPNGVDHDRFRPMDHAIVRRILGLPENRKLILFGASSATSDKRKGYQYLVEALRKLGKQVDPADYELVVFGASSGDESFPMKANYLGKLQDEISMALVYAAADVFIAPSREDNLPNTVLESLSCGTPVVAFDIGGMPDMVKHGTNGYLAPAFDTNGLAEGLRWVLRDNDHWKKLSDAARNTVASSFTLQHSAARYLDLYTEMLEVA